MHRPMGAWPIDWVPPMAGIKPILMRTPALFKGDDDDIEQFLGDCLMYFEAFQMYYLHNPALMLVFATSHLKGPAQDWWVHLRDKFWYMPPEDDEDDEAGPQYRYPQWDQFVKLFREEFRDPAIEEVHEKQMGDLHMGSNPAHVYFQKLEWEAKLANRRDDKGPHRVLVCCHACNMSKGVILQNLHTLRIRKAEAQRAD